MWALAANDTSSQTAIDTDTLGHISWNKLIPALGRLVKLGSALRMKMGHFILPGIDKPITMIPKHER